MFLFSPTWFFTRFAFFDCTVGHLVWLLFQGWLAAPLTYLLPFFVLSFDPRDSNPGWGDCRRSLVVVGAFAVVLVSGQFLSQCDLLVTRLG